MRLKELVITNFRGYQLETRVPIDQNITGVTGQNDVGKSSILEALDVFFEGGAITLDKDDFNISKPDALIEIRAIFIDLPHDIMLDDANRTTLVAEHLLNKNGELEIVKRYRRSTPNKPSVFLTAYHPNTAGLDDLHTLKLNDLKKRAGERGVDEAAVTDARTSAAWRSAIWTTASPLEKRSRDLEIGKFAEDSKTIQEKLFSQLPLFALFKSDRESKDSDPQAKNPLQEAVKQAQAELRDQIESLHAGIQQKVLERANLTLEKLKEMDPSLAAQLTPRFKTPPKWSCEFSLDDEDNIPINKRGSGVRRLILLNFFRAEAERQVLQKNAPAVIYAFEEPETSQHPSNQEMLVKALIQVAAGENCQVIVTTHVPALAGLLPTEGLRLIEMTDAGPIVRYGDENVLTMICDSLGVLPDPRVTGARGLVLVEGSSDIAFLNHTANKLKEAGHIGATFEDKGIVLVFIGGCGNLKHWRTKKLADQFGVPWGLLLDSDLGTPDELKNRKAVEDLRTVGKKAYLTRKREPENYILPEILTHFVQNSALLTYGDRDDAKKIIGAAIVKRPEDVLEVCWQRMTAAQIRQVERYVDEQGEERFEFSEMLADFLTLPRR